MESKAVTDMVVAGGVITAPVWMSGATVWMQFIGAMIGLVLLIWRVWKAYKEQ
jgi:hypothetical protein